jgi:hypothetical protein
MTMTTSKKSDIAATLTTCANGLTANYPATQSWVFETKTYTRGDILNMLQATITAAQNTKAAHDAWLAAVAAEQAQRAELRPVLTALHNALDAQWGATSTKIGEFGFVPDKPAVRTAAQKAASAAKARATRAAKKAALATVGATAPVAPAAAPTAPAPAPAAGPKTA